MIFAPEYLELARTGDLVWFAEEKKPYKIKALNSRFWICTKPMNVRKTVLYTIADLQLGVRGPDDCIFCFGYETKTQIAYNFKMLNEGETRVSVRRQIPLDIRKIEGPRHVIKKCGFRYWSDALPGYACGMPAFCVERLKYGIRTKCSQKDCPMAYGLAKWRRQ